MSPDALRRALLLAPALLSVVGAVYLVLIAVDSRPIADDWGFLGASDHLSAYGYLQHYWDTASDRFSSFVLVLASIRLFGDAAVNVTALLLLALLWGFASWAVRLGSRSLAWTGATAVGLLVAVAVVGSAPSLFDSVGWLNSTAFYLASFSTAFGIVCWVAARASDGAPARIHDVVFGFLVAAICAGFMELVGAVLVLAAVLGLVCVRDLRGRVDPRSASVPIVATGLGAATGCTVNLLGPGTRVRELAQHAHVSLSAAAGTAGHNLSFVYDDLHSAVILLAIAAGVVIWLLPGAARSARARGWLVAWAAFLLVVPWLVTSALTAWGGSTESGGRSPFRAAFLITGSVTVGAILLVLALLSQAPQLLSQARAAALGLVLVAGGLVGLAHKATPVIRAERMRAEAVAQRTASIGRQLAGDHSTIRIVPAPLLTVETQAYDLSFVPQRQQVAWIVEFLRSYYGIPPGDRLDIPGRQPADYCLPGVAAPWVGVRSCEQLRARR